MSFASEDEWQEFLFVFFGTVLHQAGTDGIESDEGQGRARPPQFVHEDHLL